MKMFKPEDPAIAGCAAVPAGPPGCERSILPRCAMLARTVRDRNASAGNSNAGRRRS